MPSNVVEGAPVTTSSSPDATLQLEEDLHLEITALPCFVKFLAELPGDFVTHEVEATRHLPILGNGTFIYDSEAYSGDSPGEIASSQSAQEKHLARDHQSYHGDRDQLNAALGQDPFQAMSE